MTSSGSVSSPAGEITQLLKQLSAGSQEVESKLVPIVYKELRQLARRYMRREKPDHTLQPTALVHETYLKLIQQRRVDWQSRAHFYGVASRLMRRILIDHARRTKDQRHGGGHNVAIESDLVAVHGKFTDFLALNEALTRLEQHARRQSQIVELRFFGGCSEEDIAKMLGISVRTVKRDWRAARAWLYAELSKT
jgi:RNA polymerase sigma factor (TIGR02999 family)